MTKPLSPAEKKRRARKRTSTPHTDAKAPPEQPAAVWPETGGRFTPVVETALHPMHARLAWRRDQQDRMRVGVDAAQARLVAGFVALRKRGSGAAAAAHARLASQAKKAVEILVERATEYGSSEVLTAKPAPEAERDALLVTLYENGWYPWSEESGRGGDTQVWRVSPIDDLLDLSHRPRRIG